MRLGPEAMEALQREVGGRMHPEEELVVAGPAALLGTSLIAKAKEKELRHRFSVNFLEAAKALYETYRIEMKQVKALGDQQEKNLYYPMGEGGFLAALWKCAEASDVGLSVDLRKVPIRQESIEVCEVLDLNPYCLYSKGAVLISVRNGEKLAAELLRQGMMAAVIGNVCRGRERKLYTGSIVRCLDRPAEDEIKGVIEHWHE